MRLFSSSTSRDSRLNPLFRNQVEKAWTNYSIHYTEEIAKLVDHWDPAKAEVEILDPVDWDRNGQYKELIDAVSEAGKGNDVRVYRIVKDSSRVEYFVVTRAGEGKNARLVGVKALAIES